MAAYRVTLRDGTVEMIDGADAYQQEGQMTTFFATASGRQVVDCWSTRVASIRTSEVLAIRRVEPRREGPATIGAEPVRVGLHLA
ncbi:hypothetical protein [Rhabdothermincola sp.]|uniref:hypothetical protein n=1 Tax=Rhabdothermincola sp. TaxID=2820405 RepID=UPI002FE2F4BA